MLLFPRPAGLLARTGYNPCRGCRQSAKPVSKKQLRPDSVPLFHSHPCPLVALPRFVLGRQGKCISLRSIDTYGVKSGD
jgi:hypothetical protein